jgi:hypothetical protein
MSRVHSTRLSTVRAPTRHDAPGPGTDVLADAVRRLDAAELRLRPVEMAIALLEVGRVHRLQGSLDAAEWYLHRGLGWARTLGALHLATEILCELAAACAAIAQQHEGTDNHRAYTARERARDHGFEATTLAARAEDLRCEASVLGRVSDALACCGDLEDCESLRRRQAALLESALA